MLYTEGQIIHAFNAGNDLRTRIREFLEDYKTYADGVNNIRIGYLPNSYISLIKLSEGMVHITIHESTYHPSYYVEPSYGFGSGYEMEEPTSTYIESHTSISDNKIKIPFHCLMKFIPESVEYLKGIKAQWDKDQAEQRRLSEVARLKAELEKLEK